MGVDTGAAGAAFAAPILSVVISNTACRTNKIRGYNTKKMSHKRKEIRAKNTRECTTFFSIFKNFPDTPSLQPSEPSFAAPIEMTWLRL